MTPHRLLTAESAADRLGVSRATLYAYVSRGFVRAHPAPDDPRLDRTTFGESPSATLQRDPRT